MEEDEIGLKRALASDPIMGTRVVTMDGHGPGALAPRGLSSPPSMTPAHNMIWAGLREPWDLGQI